MSIHTPIKSESGYMEGRVIRRARKRHVCDGFANKRGHAWIEPGDLYVCGDCNPDNAGGFGHFRYCIDCVPEASAAIATQP